MANIILTPAQIWEYSGAGDSTTPEYHNQYGHYLAMDNTLKSFRFAAFDFPLYVASCNIDGFNTTDFQGQQIPLWRTSEPSIGGVYDLAYDATGTTFYSHLKMHFGNVTHFKILILYRLNNYWHGLDMTTKYLISEPKTTWDGYATIGDVVSDTIPLPSQNTSPTQGGYVTDNAGSIWAAIAGHEINNETAKELYVGDVLFRPSVPWDNPRELYYGILIEINDDFEFIGYDEIPVVPPPPPEQPANWGEDSEPAGGDGTFNSPSNHYVGDLTGVTIETRANNLNTLLPFSAAGFRIYELDNLAIMGKMTWLLYSASFIERVQAGRYNPLSCVLSFHLIPSGLTPVVTDRADVIAGGFNFTTEPPFERSVPQQKVQKLVQSRHCGSFDFGKHFGAFPDFAPYTKIKLHLPYIGIIDIDPNVVMYGSIAVDYECELISGNVAAYVTCVDREGNRCWRYIATGNAAFHIPVFSEVQSAELLGALVTSTVTNIAATAGGTALGGFTGGRLARGGIGGLLGNAAKAVDYSAFGVPHSPEIRGTFSGNISLLMDSEVWMEITRPCWVNPEKYHELNGAPSGLSGTLNDYTGFVKVSNIEILDSFATNEEINEIESLLSEGVYHNPIV